MEKSETKFLTIFERVAVGIGLVDMEGRLIKSNPALQVMLGYREEELRDRIFTEFAHPNDATADMGLYQEVVEGKRDHYQMEKRYVRKDGAVIWGRLTVSLVRSQAGERPFTIRMVEDITEQKRLESNFLQVQKMETVGQLAGGIAHDFSNLLTVIKGYSQLSLGELKEGDPLKRNMEEVQRATERAMDLTRQLLAFSRRQVMDMKVLDLNAIITDLSRMLRYIIGEDIELITVLSPMERLTQSEYNQYPSSWSPNGETLAFVEYRPEDSASDILLLQVRDRKVTPFLNSRFDEGWPEFSPDGRWIVYASDESGLSQVYVQPFPGRGGKWQISNECGSQPQWSRNGRQLFYRCGDRYWAVDVQAGSGFTPSKPRLLFEQPGYQGNWPTRGWDISPDGRRFLMVKMEEGKPQPVAEMILVHNWFEELKRLVPAGK